MTEVMGVWGRWGRRYSPAGGRRISVLQRLGPGLVPANLLRSLAPEPLRVSHRRRKVGLVLSTPARRQRATAPGPECAPGARGHVRPAGRASGTPDRSGPGQGCPESPGAGDFATLQPRRLHERRPHPAGCATLGRHWRSLVPRRLGRKGMDPAPREPAKGAGAEIL